MALILEKCLRAYLETVRTVGKKDIWKLVPRELKEAQIQMAAATNVLYNFLTSKDKVVYGKDLFVPWKDFSAKFKTFCDDSNVPRPRNFTPTNREYWIGPFQQQNISVDTVSGLKYNGVPLVKNTKIVRGIDLIPDEVIGGD